MFLTKEECMEFRRKTDQIFDHWVNQRFDEAVSIIESMLPSQNSNLYFWLGQLVQMQEESKYSLQDAKNFLEIAVDLSDNGPEEVFELGNFLMNVEENPKEALKCFEEVSDNSFSYHDCLDMMMQTCQKEIEKSNEPD